MLVIQKMAMGLRQAVFGKLLVFVVGLSEAQWQGRSMQYSVMLKH